MSEPQTSGQGTPSAKEVLQGMKSSGEPISGASVQERRYADAFESDAVAQQAAYVHLSGISDHYRDKGLWSKFLMGAIAAMLGFQSLLLLMVGFGWWDFTSYEWLLPALLVQNLTQVVGLSVWAVKYLFSDISEQKPDKSLSKL